MADQSTTSDALAEQAFQEAFTTGVEEFPTSVLEGLGVEDITQPIDIQFTPSPGELLPFEEALKIGAQETLKGVASGELAAEDIDLSTFPGERFAVDEASGVGLGARTWNRLLDFGKSIFGWKDEEVSDSLAPAKKLAEQIGGDWEKLDLNQKINLMSIAGRQSRAEKNQSIFDPRTWTPDTYLTLAGLWLMWDGQKKARRTDEERFQIERQLAEDRLDIQRQELAIRQQQVRQSEPGPAPITMVSNIFAE